MYLSNYVEISRQTLRANAAAVCETVRVPVIGVVKCDGYGVTALEAATAWQAAGVTMFAVSRPEEALGLRHLGFREQILLLCPVADEQMLKDLVDNDVILTVTSFENAVFYCTNAEADSLRVHIAVDTGMGRFGIRWSDTEQVRAVYGLSGLSVEGIFSHFSKAFERTYGQTRVQLTRFLKVTQDLQNTGIDVGIRHIANSCAALRFPETRLDAVRIGSALVGRLPAPVPLALEKVGVFWAQVVDCKWLNPGERWGYGGTCRVKKRTYAAIVALGQGDGFAMEGRPFGKLAENLRQLLRRRRHPLYVTCNGQILPALGSIGNQHTLFDATNTNIKPGDWVQWDGHILYSNCLRRFT